MKSGSAPVRLKLRSTRQSKQIRLRLQRAESLLEALAIPAQSSVITLAGSRSSPWSPLQYIVDSRLRKVIRMLRSCLLCATGCSAFGSIEAAVLRLERKLSARSSRDRKISKLIVKNGTLSAFSLKALLATEHPLLNSREARFQQCAQSSPSTSSSTTSI